MSDETKIQDVIELRDNAAKFLQDNYFPVWGEVYESYRCQGRLSKEEDRYEADEDEDRMTIGTPLTAAWVNRLVARVTAQTPNPRVRTRNRDRSDRTSRGLMFQWDKSQAQRGLKKTVRQAGLFGWSVRGWEWANNTYIRSKRIDPIAEVDNDEVARMVDQSYPAIEQAFGASYEQLPAEVRIKDVVPWLLQEHGKANLLRVKYQHKGYRGPMPFWLSVADCYPEPNFQSVQESNWFGCERRRRRHELEAMANQFKSLRPGIEELFSRYPKGTPLWQDAASNRGSKNFRAYMAKAYPGNRFSDDWRTQNQETEMWSTLEWHYTGPKRKIQIVGAEDVWVGELGADELPDLEGMIPFAELSFIDDLAGGIGESLPRWFSGLQLLYDRQVNVRWQLIYNILRPLIGTSNRELYEDPSLVKRGAGFRMVLMRGPQEMWQQNEQAAIAAAAAGLQDASSILALYQMITGETNTSLSANVDPMQGRTATGAKLIAYTQDLMTREQIERLGQFLQDEHRLMYMFNRAESDIEMTFEGSAYRRQYAGQNDLRETQPGEPEDQMIVSPLDWQEDDAEIVVETGSTLADDDEAKAQAAVRNLQMFGGRPDMNQRKLAEDVLVTSGKGAMLNDYFVPPQPQVPPPTAKPSMSFSMKHELMSKPELFGAYEAAGIKVPGLNAAPNPLVNGLPEDINTTPPMPEMGMPPAVGGPPPPGMPPMGPPPPVPAPNLPKAILAPPPEINPGAASVRAITGRNV